ncbi:four helix bundle protein [Carboxylicivirga caseinilyticus]|uniref:four helix bundle protein n=1 Tax=Carboxylicivirga caseinilyticus TaxID=3417572 RepID=UPI003D34E4F8|nr:four helix bundle protein [Marinilabiliaceae bacterium A049]
MNNFEFKDLIVWQKAIEYANEILNICDQVKGHYRLIEQMEACSTSIPQNIAEGKGRHSLKEFIHFLHIARGSLYESVTLLVIFEKRKFISSEQLKNFETDAFEILKMINALITSKRNKLEI